MTKLEEEIFGEFYGWAVVTDDEGQPVDFYALKVHYANIAAEVAKKYIEKSAIDFFVWLCREAKVEVIHAEDALEAQGFKDRDGFVPVLTIKELYNVWALKKTE